MLIDVLNVLTELILRGIDIYRIVLVVYFLLSWMPGGYQSKLGEILIRICEPYVGIFRRFVPPIGMISLAGIVAFFALTLVEQGIIVVYQLLFNFLIRLG